MFGRETRFLLREVLAAIRHLIKEFRQMSEATNRLTASVAANTAAVDALSGRIATLPAGEDTAAITAAADAVDASTAKLNALAQPTA